MCDISNDLNVKMDILIRTPIGRMENKLYKDLCAVLNEEVDNQLIDEFHWELGPEIKIEINE